MSHATRNTSVPLAVAACLGTTALAASPAAASAGQPYTVRQGDTVGHIAVRTGTTVDAIRTANGLDSRAFIRAGQVISIPGRAPAAAAAAPAASAPAAAATGYVVVPGDTVSGIAARTGTTVDAIVAANALDSRAFIRAGQVLSIPGRADAAAPAPAPAPAAPAHATYTVRSGDTVSHIAARTGHPVSEILTLNGLQSRTVIHVGQVLQMPAASTPMPNTFAGRTYPDAVVQAATANRDVLASRSVPSREQMQQLIADTARHWGVDPALAQAVAFQESGFNMRAVSPANAVGAMQVIPSSGRWAAELSGRPIDLLDPQDNVTAGVVILRALTRAEADLPTAIAAYYQGLASVRRNGMYDDTRRYVANIQTLMGRFR